MFPNRARFGAQNQVVTEFPIEAPAQAQGRTQRIFILIRIVQRENRRVFLGKAVDVDVGVLQRRDRPEHQTVPMEIVTGGNKGIELPAIGRTALESEDVAAVYIITVVSATGTAIDIKSAPVPRRVQAKSTAVSGQISTCKAERLLVEIDIASSVGTVETGGETVTEPVKIGRAHV